MNNKLVQYKDNQQLVEYCNKRHNGDRISENPTTFFRQTVYLLNPQLKEFHNADPYFLTITFPRNNNSLDLQWKQAVEWMEGLKQQISKKYIVIAGIIAIEPHKNTTLKSKKGKNIKAGLPHFHMVVWIAHDFLNPSIQVLRTDFNENNILVKINKLKSNVDTVKAILYTLKDKGNQIVISLCKKHTNWPSNINVWVNHTDMKRIFHSFCKKFPENQFFITYENYVEIPTTRFHKDKGLLLSELFTKIFRLHHLAVKDKYVYKRIENTLFSWERTISLQNWVANTFTEKAPVQYLAMLKEHANWVANQGKAYKAGINYDLFPKLKLQMFLVEFLDKVYEFKSGKTLEFQQIDYEINSICHVKTTFDEIQPPYFTLALLHVLINFGRNDMHEVNKVRLLTEKTNLQQRIIDTWDKLYDSFYNALTVFGGLYHFSGNRKQNKVLFLSGEPNTFKTSLLKALLGKLVGLDHVDILSRTAGKFNLANLRKDDDSPYILVMDDLRWENLGLTLPDFLNLLDGNFVLTEQKYQAAQHGTLKGNMAITSNQKIFDEQRDYQDTKALRSRMHEVGLYTPQEGIISNAAAVINALQQEAIGFSVLTNIIYLKNKCDRSVNDLHIPRSFYSALRNSDTKKFHKIGENLLATIMENFRKS